MEGESNSTSNEASESLQSLSISDKLQMSLKERFDIIRSIGEECIQEDELERLLANKPQPICYDGFEPSGRMHIAQGVMKAINVNKLTSAGCKVKIWIADWFAQLNNKMGGDLKKIHVIGEYLIEIWKAVGMNIEGGQVEFLWSSQEINARAHEYWPLVMDIARRNKLPRIMRCCQIMGRSDQDELSAAQIFYPCMQCADIFFLKADICQLGMDQRKVNVLAREYCDDIKRKNKPIILSHHMLPGLQEGQEKMSKTDASSSIYMEDDEAEVNLKIKKAFCPPKIVEKNPCMEYIEYIILPWFNKFKVERKPENGGDKIYESFKDLVDDYESGELHPGDLKPALAKALNRILQPVRDHFTTDPIAKDLLKRVKFVRQAQLQILDPDSWQHEQGECGIHLHPQLRSIPFGSQRGKESAIPIYISEIQSYNRDSPIDLEKSNINDKGGRKRVSWTKEEDELLAKSFVTISEGTIVSNDQDRDSFWRRVSMYYNENKPPHFVSRDANGVRSKWNNTIREKVNRFNANYNSIYNAYWSDCSNDDILSRAYAKYREEHNGIAFNLEHVWRIVKDCPIFSPQSNPEFVVIKKSRTDESGGSSTLATQGVNTNFGLNEDVRPIGQKIAERRGKLKFRASMESITTEAVNLVKKIDELKKVELNAQNEMERIKQEELELKRARQRSRDYEILMRHTGLMTSKQLVVHEKMCQLIRQQWGWD